MASKVSGSYSFTIGDTVAPDVSKAGSFDTGTIVEHISDKVTKVSGGIVTLNIPAADKAVFLHVKLYDSSGDPAQGLLTINGQIVAPHFTELIWINDDTGGSPIYILAVVITTVTANTTIEYQLGSLAA